MLTGATDHLRSPRIECPRRSLGKSDFAGAAAGGRADGIPYPGTFVVDQEWIVRAKLFYEGYQERLDAAELLKAIKGIN